MWVCAWSIHHNPEYWPDPYKVDPSRFLDEEGNVVPPDHPAKKRYYWNILNQVLHLQIGEINNASQFYVNLLSDLLPELTWIF